MQAECLVKDTHGHYLDGVDAENYVRQVDILHGVLVRKRKWNESYACWTHTDHDQPTEWYLSDTCLIPIGHRSDNNWHRYEWADDVENLSSYVAWTDHGPIPKPTRRSGPMPSDRYDECPFNSPKLRYRHLSDTYLTPI